MASLSKKYKDMANTRSDWNSVNVNNFMLPTMGEMIEEDLMNELLQHFVDGDSNNEFDNQDFLDAAYYVEEPFSFELGYHAAEAAFVLKTKNLANHTVERTWALNQYDGDTTRYLIADLDDGNDYFTFNDGKSYKSFKDYYSKMGGSGTLTVRHVGIDAPEIPHYEIQAVPKHSDDFLVETMTFKEMKELVNRNNVVYYVKYPVNKDKTEIIHREDNDPVKLLKVNNKGKTLYYEIINQIDKSNIEDANDNYNYYTILGKKDESELSTVLDGYKAQKTIRDMMDKTSEIVLVLDANQLSSERMLKTGKTFNSLYYMTDAIDYMIEQWDKSYGDLPSTNYSYRPYGSDSYSRTMGAVYIKIDLDGKPSWINLNKYIAANIKSIKTNPDYNSSPELQEMKSGMSEVFELWSYTQDNIEWLDSFNNLTKKPYNDKIELHKKITGLDFTKERECSLMIGDTFLLIPPESIRNITQVNYEKIPSMRSKGTMAKQMGQNEHMLELSLYFYGEEGLNGIPYVHTFPNGKKQTYYMNGLRSLISQFKVAPYLPIENGYINDVLGIEAVSLMNMNIETVKGFPRLYRVILSLREFNYRTFMPDLPVDDVQGENNGKLSELNPMFAKSFNWEMFRYYYQRGIDAGQKLSEEDYASYEWNLKFYQNKNTIGPWNPCDYKGLNTSSVSFYIPDENWLEQALQIKKERESNYMSNFSGITLSLNAEEFLTNLALLYEAISKIKNKEANNFEKQVSQLFSQHGNGNKNIVLKIPVGAGFNDDYKVLNITDANYSCMYIQDGWKKINKEKFQDLYVSQIYNSFRDSINNPIYMTGLNLNEILTFNRNDKKDIVTISVTWEFNIRLNTDGITDDDMLAIREVLSKESGVDMSLILKDNIVKVNFTSLFQHSFVDLNGTVYEGSGYGVLLAGADGTSHTTDTFMYIDTNDTNALSSITTYKEKIDSEDEDSDSIITDTEASRNEQNLAIDYYVRDYKNPANMPFVPYLENILAEQMGSTMANTFTDISLKAVEGVGPQYLGGQDIIIELNLITDDIVTVSALNNLPNMASSISKRYKRVLPAWPLKIRCALTDMLGVSEVLIDAIEVSTIEGLPGVYSIAMRLTSVDRTQRQREALRRLDVTPTGGKVDYKGASNLAMRSFFEIEKALAQAELYPDLDLPSIKELAQLGYRYVKYSGQSRSYVDPDFYITYAYPYTSLIIKKLVNENISKQLLDLDGDGIGENLQKFTLEDTMGAKVSSKIERFTGLEIDGDIKDTAGNEVAKTYEEILLETMKSVRTKVKNMKSLPKTEDNSAAKRVEKIYELSSLLSYLTMCNVNEGWEIKPGWSAPLCTESTNDAVRDLTKEDKKAQENAYAKDIKERRKKALRLIDNILTKPLSNRYSDTPDDNRMDAMMLSSESVIKVVSDMFGNDDGKELLKLLCPGIDIEEFIISQGGNYPSIDAARVFTKKFYEEPNPINYLIGYTYAAGCALSGHQEYRINSSPDKWGPNHYGFGSEMSSRIYAEDYPNMLMPYCVEDTISGKPILSSKIESAVNSGICFGAYRITKYSSATVVSNIADRTDNTIMYGGHFYDATYKDKDDEREGKKYVKEGFLDPYYNYLDSENGKEQLIEYKRKILTSKNYNIEAFLRIMLVHLRKLILDGLLISEIDIIASNFDELVTELELNNLTQTVITSAVQGSTAQTNTDIGHALEKLGIHPEELKTMVSSIYHSNRRSLCARLIYPFLTAITKSSSDIYLPLKQRDYRALNALTGYVEGGDQNSESRSTVIKFLSAMAGMDLTSSKEGKNESSISEAQQLANNMMKDIYIEASKDPRAYLLHSFYDMLVNDKRGRLVRAFPTYYVVFIDEGRKIGSWKLHDNFYNMNSIAEIQVVKSRKIAADTCTIVMNNMFNSYTMEPDITTTQQYTDIYGLRDVFNSIFSPQIYFEKEKRIRLRQTVPEKVVLQPGIRIHVRMGYSADGSKLPIVFNGKVAEVDVADVASIVAQGDGHELMNPLNAFGEMEVTSLDPATSAVTWFKDIRGSLAKGGETPRDLLAKLLTAKHGGWKKVANYWFDGRWFNDNPFGITHFGDPKFNAIFDLGEPVQNLYEIADESLLKDVNELYVEDTSPKASPIINTSLQDKTLWDILHLCANTGLEYIGAIRDFGFRSTIFLGKPSDYYAYAYTQADGKVIEKRKPFQQFHYYDSYNDIIYNSIKASEAQMKTNAVGLWQASSPLWGREQATVGPIYLDMNIYPEYQKSMTVDTGLLASGNGKIDIPLFTHLAESWNLSPNDDKVNKSTAWRVTANALKNSVKDMYQGDVGVIGDPSVKPYDRCYIYDTYEDMMGQFEVEAVIHTMSSDTGFTTSIMPDVIARHEDKFESSIQSLLSSTTSLLTIMVAGNIAEKLWSIGVNNKLVTAVSKSAELFGASQGLRKATTTLSSAIGMDDYLDKHPTAKNLFDTLSFNPKETNLNVNRISGLIDELAEASIEGDFKSNVKLFNTLFKKYQEIDIDAYQKAINDVIEKDDFGFLDHDKLNNKNELFKKMLDAKNELDNAIKMENIDLTSFRDSIINNRDIYNKVKTDSRLFKIIEKWRAEENVKVDAEKLKQFSELLSDKNIQDALTKGDISIKGIDEIFENFKSIFKSSNKTSIKGLKTALKADDIIGDILKAAKGLVKFNWATLLADIAINSFVYILTKNTQAVFTRWLQGIQAIDVYPLKKNGKPLIAGMNGHKGSVYGYPVVEGYDSIQGMIMQAIGSIKSMDGNFPIQWADGLVDMFVDSNVLSTLSTEWKRELGLDNPGTEYILDERGEDLKQSVYNSVSSQYASMGNHPCAIKTKYRKTTFHTNNRTDETYKMYEIKGINSSNIATNDRVQKLYYINRDDDIWRAVVNKDLVISHSSNYTNIVTIYFESGSERVPVFYEKGIFDTPLIQEDALFVLKSLIRDDSLKGKIHFKSGARFNDVSYTWKTTGFSFMIEYKGSETEIITALDNLREDTRMGTRNLFAYKQSGDKFTIAIYPPVITSEKEENKQNE